jgi:nucleotide-binding universal stress UspA family protein
VYRVGHAAEAISRFAEEGRFDLVAMGSRGRSNLVNLLLGSVALKVLARCSVPVLLIR